MFDYFFFCIPARSPDGRRHALSWHRERATFRLCGRVRGALSFGADNEKSGKLLRRSRGLRKWVRSSRLGKRRNALSAAPPPLMPFPAGGEADNAVLVAQMASNPGTHPETPARALLLNRPSRADCENTHFGAIREQFVRTSQSRRDRQPEGARRRTEQGRCVFSSHCLDRLMRPMRGFPAFIKSLITFLRARGKREGEKGRAGKHSCLRCSAQETLKTNGLCWTEMMSPPNNKNETHSQTPC